MLIVEPCVGIEPLDLRAELGGEIPHSELRHFPLSWSTACNPLYGSEIRRDVTRGRPTHDATRTDA